MKNIKSIVIIIMVLALVMTVGCSGGSEKTTAVTTSLLSGSPNGVWSMLSTGIGEALNKTYPGSVVHTAPGAPVPNLLKLNDNDAEFALFHTNLAFEAYRGIGQFDGVKDNISAVAVFYPSVAQLIFRKDFGVTTLKEIIDNKIPFNISAGPAESSMDTTFKRILAEYDLTYSDLEEWGCKIYNKGFADTSTMFSDEAIDGFFLMAGAPTSFVTQLSVNEEMIMMELEQSVLDSMIDKYGHGQMSVSSGKYTFMDEGITTINTFTMLGAAASVSEDTVYALTKSLYENLDYVKSLHAALGAIDSELLIMDSGMPLHPGAERYYKEIGLID